MGAQQAQASPPSFVLCAHAVIKAGFIRKAKVKDEVTCLEFSSSPASSVGYVCLKPKASDSFVITMLLGRSSQGLSNPGTCPSPKSQRYFPPPRPGLYGLDIYKIVGPTVKSALWKMKQTGSYCFKDDEVYSTVGKRVPGLGHVPMLCSGL